MAGRSIISMPPGMMPAPMMSATHWPACSLDGKPISSARAVSGFLRMRTVTSVTTPSKPFRTGHHAEQVVAFAVEMRAAEPDHRPVHQHHLDAEHIVGGQPVFQAVHAAGILGDVAADRAGDLRRRVGRVVEAVLLDGVGDAEIGDAGLRDDDAVRIVDRQDAVEAAHDQQHRILERQRAARQRRAGAARHHADVAVAAVFQDARDLRHGLRQHHHQRQLAIGGEPVALEGAHAGDLVDDALARHDDAHIRDDLGAARQRRGVGLRHGDAGHLFASSRLRCGQSGKEVLPVGQRVGKQEECYLLCSFGSECVWRSRLTNSQTAATTTGTEMAVSNSGCVSAPNSGVPLAR